MVIIIMKQEPFGKPKKQRFFSGKGFYAALAFSLVAVGGAAWLGISSAMDGLEQEAAPNQPPVASQNTDSTGWNTASEYEVNKPESNIPVESEPEESSSAAETTPTEAPVFQGYALPLNGEILNEYSGDKVVKSKTLDDWVMHTGIDLAAPDGTPVKAAAAGKVTEVKNDALWGTTVTLEHPNGVISYYANLKSAVPVKEGQSVKLGDVIGNVGQTADIERAEEAHLHFGMKQNGDWIDPFSLIK